MRFAEISENFVVIFGRNMEAETQSSCREVCRQLVRHLRKVGKEKFHVRRKFLAEVANTSGNVEEAKVTSFGSIFLATKMELSSMSDSTLLNVSKIVKVRNFRL